MILTGYQALREGAAVFDLSGRGFIVAVGEDRARLLHAMTTNHVEQLQPGQSCYAFFLTAQGRILGDVHLLCASESFVLDTEPETRQHLYEHLDKYIIADDVILRDESEQRAVIGLEGPKAAEILRRVGLENPPEVDCWIPWKGGMLAGISVTGGPGYRIYAPAGDKRSLLDWLMGTGALEATAEEVRTVRLENARPRYGDDVDESCLVQETRLMDAVHVNKGCYLGQEIVERVRSRGHVNRLLVQLHLDTEQAPERGTKLSFEGKEAGQITSAVLSPSLGKVVAFGYTRAERAAPGTELDAGGVRAVVTPAAPR